MPYPIVVTFELSAPRTGCFALNVQRLVTLLCVVSFMIGFTTAKVQANQFGKENPDASGTATSAAPLDLNVRVVWGGSLPANYSGSIELDHGKLVSLHQLGIDPFDPSFLKNASDDKLPFEDRATKFGGCDIRVLGKSTCRLKVRITSTDPQSQQTSTKEYEWMLNDLRENAHVENLELGDCRLSVDRVPGDRLRVTTSRNHLIYNSEESLSLQIQPCLLPWISTSGTLEYAIFDVKSGHELARQSKSLAIDELGNSESSTVLLSAPRDEGVYELRLKLEPKRKFTGMLTRSPVVERNVQFVVYNDPTSVQPRRESLPWQTLSEIDIQSFEIQSQTEHLLEQGDGAKRFPLLEAAKSVTLGRKDSHAVSSKGTSAASLSLVPGNQGVTTLSGLVPGEMHRLTVTTLNHNAPCRVVVSETQTRDRKKVKLACANEVFHATVQRSVQRSVQQSVQRSVSRNLESSAGLGYDKFEVLFWPTSRSANLEISNLSSNHSIEIPSVQVDVLNGVVDVSTTGVEGINAAKTSDRTLSTLEFHSSNIRNFSARMARSNRISGSYDDWELFLEFAESTAKYCMANGFESFAMVVDGEGGTLFPSSKFSSNYRFDTGIFSSDGRDPIRKDVVELMYRSLARYGIDFIPMFELSSQLIELEQAIVRKEELDVMQRREQQIRSDERDLFSQRKYNPLSERVQRAIAAGLDEFESRYRSHVSYKGIAMRLSDASHLTVSNSIGDTNTAILEQFASETGSNIPRESVQRDPFVSQKAKALYHQWHNNSIYTYLKKLKVAPRWISVPSENTSIASNGELPIYVALQVGPNGLDLSDAKAAILNRWNTDSPRPIHIAMTQPTHILDSSLANLFQLSKPFQSDSARSVLHRDGARSISRARVWSDGEHGESLLISNAGAVAETIVVGWDSMPRQFQVTATFADSNCNPRDSIDSMNSLSEWRIALPAGEAIRIDLADDSKPRPLYWFSDDAMTLRLLQAGLQSVDEAINRMSIPQAIVGVPTNASFEEQTASHRRGRIEGWTTSIDPNAPVSINSQSASDGGSSIKIDANHTSSIAWLQSDPFAMTTTDRLSVAFHAAAAMNPEKATVSLWQFDPKTERFELKATREFQSKLQRSAGTTAWNPIRFDFTKEFENTLKPFETQLVRLQFEVNGKGQTWLDQVTLSTDFLRDEERRDLRSELFLARSSLQKGDSGPAVKMLTSPRGRLVRWGNSSMKSPNVFVSTSLAKEQLIPSASVLPEKPDSTPKSSKRTRSFWWPSRNKE
ncbi:MAG: hypothetical protein WCK15_19360 [Pirellula sp.]